MYLASMCMLPQVMKEIQKFQSKYPTAIQTKYSEKLSNKMKSYFEARLITYIWVWSISRLFLTGQQLPTPVTIEHGIICE